MLRRWADVNGASTLLASISFDVGLDVLVGRNDMPQLYVTKLSRGFVGANLK
jgi:hypothetical protein